MTLTEILAGVPLAEELPAGLAAAPVLGLEYDSRRAGPGFLYFAFAGTRADGRRFARDAMERGALAVASELPRPEDFAGPWIAVRNGRQALARAARNFYGAPDGRLVLTGITGTNGKTTTAYILDSILREWGKTTALVGTIEYRLAGRVLPAVNTTPESLDLYRLFARLENEGGSHATMEVSSHALALGRVYGIRFHTAVFTNLTRDHLDFHRTIDEYFSAKSLLFEGLGAPPPKCAVLNWDDPYARRLAPAGETFWYGLGEGARVRAAEIASGFGGLRFTLDAGDMRFDVASPLVGRFNVYNILAASCAALSLGVEPEAIARGVAQCGAVPGRLEPVDEGQPFLVLVDYAHTDDALRNVISVARGLTSKRVITLFGCGGDRDRAKRPLMGEAAGALSDFAILTSDNPRSEDPLAIMNDALVGLRRHDTPHVVEPDREKAIRRALQEAQAGDVVILAGKGHETYQVLKDRTIHFDDREAARGILRGFGYTKEAR